MAANVPSGSGPGQVAPSGQAAGQEQTGGSNPDQAQSYVESIPQISDDQWNVGSIHLRASPPSGGSSASFAYIRPPRPITHDVFQEYAANGKRLYKWMSEKNPDTLTKKMSRSIPPKLEVGEKSQSKFNEDKDIEDNGWTKNPRECPYHIHQVNLKYCTPVYTILKDFGISPEVPSADKQDAPNVPVIFQQDNIMFNGKEHDRPSEGSFTGTCNPKDGLVVICEALSPARCLADSIRLEEPYIKDFELGLRIRQNLPALNRISDLFFLEWQEQCTTQEVDPRNLRISIMNAVDTASTIQVIEHILIARGYEKVMTPRVGTYEPPPWEKRLTLKPNSDAFYAVLGTPDAAMNAYLLLQHKEQLGLKRIKAIHISLDSGQIPRGLAPFNGPTLTFEFEDLNEKGKSIASGSVSGSRAGGGGSVVGGDSQAGSSKQPQEQEQQQGDSSPEKGEMARMKDKAKSIIGMGKKKCE